MMKRDLICLMAALIYAAAKSNPGATPEGAVNRARAIWSENERITDLEIQRGNKP